MTFLCCDKESNELSKWYGPSYSIDTFKHQKVLLFGLTPMHDATENCHQPELVGKTLKLQVNFTIPLKRISDFIVLEAGMSSFADD